MQLLPLQVQRVCPYARAARIKEILPHLNACLPAAGVSSPLRAAMLLAQVAHESAEFRFFEELSNGTAYDSTVNPRLALKLGNTQPGDGPRFKGRGPIQLTGRKRYAAATLALGVDYLSRPELVALPEHGFRVLAWYWRHAPDRHDVEHDLNTFADAGDVEGCTQVINGGMNGLLFRKGYYERAKEALGLQ